MGGSYTRSLPGFRTLFLCYQFRRKVPLQQLSYPTIPNRILQSALRPFQNQFATQCDLVLPLSIYSILSSSLRSYSSYLRLLSRLPVPTIHPSIFPSIACFKRQFLHKTLPTELAFLFIACKMFLSLL